MRSILGIRADWKAWFFCVLAACTFWFLKALNNDYTDEIYYPIKFEYNDKKVVPLKKLPRYIRLNVSGYGWLLLKNYIGIKVDPVVYKPKNLPKRNYVLASELLPLVKKQIKDINLNYIITDTIFFEFDKVYMKKVKVVVDSADISLADSYKITTPIVVTPDTILFKGPFSLLDKLSDSMKIKIPATGIQEDFNQKIKLPEPGNDYRVELLHKEVRVRFGVENFEKGSITVPVTPMNFPEGQYVHDNKVIITYYVASENKNKISTGSFEAFLDYRKLDRNDSTIKPHLIKKPSFVKDFYFTPYAVRIRKK